MVFVCFFLFVFFFFLICQKVQLAPGQHDSLGLTVIALSMLVLPFIPATNLFFYVGFVVAERVLYIPSIGFCLTVAVGCHVVHDVRLRGRRRLRRAFRAALVVLLLLLAARTVRRNQDWLTEESLYRSGITINPPKGPSSSLFFFSSFSFSPPSYQHRSTCRGTDRWVVTPWGRDPPMGYLG